MRAEAHDRRVLAHNCRPDPRQALLRVGAPPARRRHGGNRVPYPFATKGVHAPPSPPPRKRQRAPPRTPGAVGASLGASEGGLCDRLLTGGLLGERVPRPRLGGQDGAD